MTIQEMFNAHKSITATTSKSESVTAKVDGQDVTTRNKIADLSVDVSFVDVEIDDATVFNCAVAGLQMMATTWLVNTKKADATEDVKESISLADLVDWFVSTGGSSSIVDQYEDAVKKVDAIDQGK